MARAAEAGREAKKEVMMGAGPFTVIFEQASGGGLNLLRVYEHLLTVGTAGVVVCSGFVAAGTGGGVR